jgi:hypothetical protein
VIAAQADLSAVEDAVYALGYGDGCLDTLRRAERTLEAAEQVLADREETISHPLWCAF